MDSTVIEEVKKQNKTNYWLLISILLMNIFTVLAIIFGWSKLNKARESISSNRIVGGVRNFLG